MKSIRLKKLLFTALVFLFVSIIEAQERKYFTDTIENEDFIILKKDTVYAFPAREFLINFISREDYLDYHRSVFRYSSKNYLMQWKSEIKIYLHKDVEKSVKDNFSSFIKSFPKINNLKISIVSKLENANYFITPTDNFKSIYTKTKLTNEELKKKLYYNIFYQIEREGNSLKSCVLNFDPKRIYDKEIFSKKLKTAFTSSLGQFYFKNHSSAPSILLENRPDINSLTEYDIKLLKYHYQNLFDQRINRSKFRQMYKNNER